MHNSKNIAEAYAERVWNFKDLAAINELIDQQCSIHSLLGDFYGPDAMKKVVQAWLIGFPNFVVKNNAIIKENDLVVIHWEAQRTHQGIFKGIQPTHKPVAYAGVTIYRIAKGKIVEYWAYLDMQHLLQQIT